MKLLNMHNQENVGLCFCAVFTKLTKIYCKICRYFKLLLTYGKIKNIMNLQYMNLKRELLSHAHL